MPRRTAAVTCTVQHAAERIYTDGSYVLAFGPDRAASTNLWALSRDGRMLEHIHILQTLEHPGKIKPIIDADRGLVAIAKYGPGVSEIHVYDMGSGDVVQTIGLYGALEHMRMPYSSRLGRAVVNTDIDELPRVLLVDIAGRGSVEGAACIPPDLRYSDCVLSPYFSAVHFSDEGDIVCSHTAPPRSDETHYCTLMRWSGTPTEDTLPEARAVLPLLLEDGDFVMFGRSAPLGLDAFVLSSFEAVLEAIETAWSRQSVVRSIDTRSLAVRWTAEPLWGRVTDLYSSNDASLVFAVGEWDTREDAGDAVMVTFVAALDAVTGALRRYERVGHDAQGTAVRVCAVTESAIVLVFANGDVSVTPLDDFLDRGFARDDDGEKVIVSHPWNDGPVTVRDAVVAVSSVVIATDTELAVVSW